MWKLLIVHTNEAQPRVKKHDMSLVLFDRLRAVGNTYVCKNIMALHTTCNMLFACQVCNGLLSLLLKCMLPALVETRPELYCAISCYSACAYFAPRDIDIASTRCGTINNLLMYCERILGILAYSADLGVNLTLLKDISGSPVGLVFGLAPITAEGANKPTSTQSNTHPTTRSLR